MNERRALLRKSRRKVLWQERGSEEVNRKVTIAFSFNFSLNKKGSE